MSRDFLKELQEAMMRHGEEPMQKEFPSSGSHCVIRCTLPPTTETPVFFNVTEHEAKMLVFRVLKAKNMGQYAKYYDWTKEKSS